MRNNSLSPEQRAEMRTLVDATRAGHETSGSAKNGTPSGEEATTPVQIILNYWRARYDFAFRREDRAWSRIRGAEVRFSAVNRGPATPLLLALRTAQGGQPEKLIRREWPGWVSTAWADLLENLPDEAECEEVFALAEDRFRRRLAKALGRIVTVGRRVHGADKQKADSASHDQGDTEIEQHSLIELCRKWMGSAAAWGSIRGWWLWTRRRAEDEGKQLSECIPRVALRPELFGQLSGLQDLAELGTEEFRRLCVLYNFGEPCRVGHGGKFGIELSRDFVADLLGSPEGE